MRKEFTESDILKFIQDVRKIDPEIITKLYTEGYCYHFAKMLKEVFGGVLYYQQITGHFVLRVKNKYYDVTGEVIINEPTERWSKIKKEDPKLAQRIIDGCVYKK